MMFRGELPFGRIAILAISIGLFACDPWEGFGKGEDGLGPVDPVTFPAANLGRNGNRLRPGIGYFQETTAFVGGATIGYFPYLYPSATIPDPLRLREDGRAYARMPTIGAYVFDGVAGPNPLPDKNACSPPPGYTFDEIRDEVRFDQQGSVFAGLPLARYPMGVAASTDYVPVVAEWPKSSAGKPCQALKSRTQVEAALGPQMPSGRFLAWLIIDPSAGVYKFDDDRNVNKRGIDLQKWGWFNRYLLAYLDGGVIPTMEETITEMGVSKQVVLMQVQRLYYPRSPVIATNASGMTEMGPGQRGAGYDILTARRGEPGYSPVCEVFTYDAGPTPVPAAMLPKTAAAAEMMMPMPATSNRYIFCLQVR